MSKFTDSLSHLWPNTRQEWIMILFLVAGVLISGMAIWQLNETSPGRWCGLAEVTAPDKTTACLTVLQSLLTIKDHAIIALLTILGLTVVSLAAVALGVGIKAGGPGGTSVDIGAKETKIETEEASVTVPTPPSEGTK